MKIRTKNRIYIILLLAVVLSFCVCFFCSVSANKAYAAETQTATESAALEQVDEQPTQDNTFFGQIFAWCKENIVPLLSATNLGTIFAVIVSLRKEIKDNKRHKSDIQAETAANTESNAEVIKAANTLIEKYNDFEIYVKELTKTELERSPQFQEMITYSKAVLDILSAVYANNKNIPQAIKDLVQLKYVGALKDVNSVEDTEAGGDAEV